MEEPKKRACSDLEQVEKRFEEVHSRLIETRERLLRLKNQVEITSSDEKPNEPTAVNPEARMYHNRVDKLLHSFDRYDEEICRIGSLINYFEELLKTSTTTSG